MSLQVDGVDFFTAIFKVTGEFVCWYYTPEGDAIVSQLDFNNTRYNLVDLTPSRIKQYGLTAPDNYSAPKLPEFNEDCEVPPYTAEQLVILNTLEGIDNLMQSMIELEIEGFNRDSGIDYPLIRQTAVFELLEKFKKDFQDGKIA